MLGFNWQCATESWGIRQKGALKASQQGCNLAKPGLSKIQLVEAEAGKANYKPDRDCKDKAWDK